MPALTDRIFETTPPRVSLDAIPESSADAIIITAADGAILNWNQAAEELYNSGRQAGLTRTAIRDHFGEVTSWVITAQPPRLCPLEQRDCEGRFRALFDANPVPMWVYDCETLRFIEVNQAAVKRYGYSREEFLSRKVTDIRPAEDVPRLMEFVATEQPIVRNAGCWRHIRKDGTLITVEIASHLVSWQGGRAALVVAHDVSELKRAADSLRASEERFRSAFEDAPFGMCLSSLDGRFLQVNGALCQLLGYSREELLGGAWLKITHPDDAAPSKQAAEQLKCREVTSVEFEKRYIHKGGNTIWARMRVSVVNGADGKPSHFISHMEDITARRQAERALLESEEKYRSLISHIPDVVWVADGDGRVVFVSPNGERLIGLGIDEVYRRGSRALLELVHPDDAARVILAFHTLFAGDQTYDQEFRVRGPGGQWIWVHDRAMAAYEKDGVRYASGLRSDVSERRRVEAALRARDAAEDANRTKSAFLANMSHELRTPLNAIIGYSQLLQEDCHSPACSEALADLEKIERSAQILLAIINDVLDLSKIEAGRMNVKLENVDLAAVLEDVLGTVAPLARQQGNAVSLECPPEARWVYADISKLRQCLLNLVNNACKFTENGSVSVTARRGSGNWIEVRVTDTGIGIPSEKVGKLFQPFTQLDDSTTRKYNGTGLGLAICKRFCQMMGAEIVVDSEPGRGSCFTLWIPAPRDLAATKPDLAGLESLADAGPGTLGKHPSGRD